MGSGERRELAIQIGDCFGLQLHLLNAVVYDFIELRTVYFIAANATEHAFAFVL